MVAQGTQTLLSLKTQLNVAVGQREEDPERAWLEAISVRERLGDVARGAAGDERLLADVTRFRARLDDAIVKLTRDIGDSVIAPLYSWIDLVRQHDRLAQEVETARTRVSEARAARGAASSALPQTEADAVAALESSEKELTWWKGELPPLPSREALQVWAAEGGEALRGSMPTDPTVARARGTAGRARVGSVRGRTPGTSTYAGSRRELLLLPASGAVALLSAMFAFAGAGPRVWIDALAVVACGAFAAALVTSVATRRRATSEREGAVAEVWHYTLYSEQASLVDIEVGWLRALAAALRARQAFDAHKGEGGQLAELARWRPDLTAVVLDVAKSSVAPPA